MVFHLISGTKDCTMGHLSVIMLAIVVIGVTAYIPHEKVKYSPSKVSYLLQNNLLHHFLVKECDWYFLHANMFVYSTLNRKVCMNLNEGFNISAQYGVRQWRGMEGRKNTRRGECHGKPALSIVWQMVKLVNWNIANCF